MTLFLIQQQLFAKDYKLVVRDQEKPCTGNTEIHISPDDNTATIVVKPATDVTDIIVKVKDVDGTIVSQSNVPAFVSGTYTLSVPSLSSGTLVEISDNKGIVYTSYEQ